jgi:hypothetical protein
MTKLLVDTPTGKQEVIEVQQGGGYFDPARVLWDERKDGVLPAITVGGMVRNGNTLRFDNARKTQHDTACIPVPAPKDKADLIMAALIAKGGYNENDFKPK